MPRGGHISSTLNTRASQEDRDFALALRSLCEYITLPARSSRDARGLASHKAICEIFGARRWMPLTEVQLSRYLRATSSPCLELGKRLLELALEASVESGGAGNPLITMAELERLYQRAKDAQPQIRRRRQAGRLTSRGHSPGVVIDGGPLEVEVVAASRVVGGCDPFSDDPSSDMSAEECKPANVPVSAPGGMPVPPTRGDRHASTDDSLDIEERSSVLRYVVDGSGSDRYEDVRTALFHLGRSASTAETASAVMACREAGLHPAADTILSSAAGRPIREILDLALHLSRRSAFDDVNLLLASASSRPRSE
jgi:hypothetical protein